MGYKIKPNKSVAKRFKVSKTGKLKRHHSFTSHLMSSRSANKRRKLRKPAVLFEGLAKNMRKLMGVSHLNPKRTAHEAALRAAAAGEGGEGQAATGSDAGTPAGTPAKAGKVRHAKPTRGTRSSADRKAAAAAKNDPESAS